MVRALAAALLLAGCDGVFSIDEIDTSEACFGRNGANSAGLFEACAVGKAPPWRHPGSVDTGMFGGDAADCTQVVIQEDASMTDACVVVADTIEITEPMTLTGKRPLVFVATKRLVIAANLAMSGGPGAFPPLECGDGATSGKARSAGGAGGSFTTGGGAGGASSFGLGGAAQPAVDLASVRGGCAGGTGVGGNGAGGEGGEGGGALYLIAGEEIVISATIDASGIGGSAGGRSSSSDAGGAGGGGAGGLIGLDAPKVVLEPTAKLFAHGGGGGGGGGAGASSTNGSMGGTFDPSSGPPYLVTGGPGGIPNGGAGGVAAAGVTDAQKGATVSIAGPGAGGGGGGLGAINVYTPMFDGGSAVVSPPPTVR